MTVVLVHGNPETDAVWGPLVDALGRTDVVRLSPPGFGAPLPSGFPATYLAYRDWLVDELQRIDEPVDLVGHDWGGCHVVNAVMHRPDLVRSWASDVVGMFDPDYVWHDMAQGFQTPEAGEQVVEAMIGRFAGRTGRNSWRPSAFPQTSRLRLPQRRVRRWVRAILAVYRSARQPALADAGRALENAAARPGLSIAGHRGPLRRHRRDAAPGGRPGRRPDRGARRAGTLVDGGGPAAAPRPSPGSGNRLTDNGSAVVLTPALVSARRVLRART